MRFLREVAGVPIWICDQILKDSKVVGSVSGELIDKAVEVMQKSFQILQEGRVMPGGGSCTTQALNFVLGDMNVHHWVPQDDVSAALAEKEKPSPLLVLEVSLWSALSDSEHLFSRSRPKPFKVLVDVERDWEFFQTSYPGEELHPGPQMLADLAKAMFARYDPEYDLAVAINGASGYVRTKDVKAVL